MWRAALSVNYTAKVSIAPARVLMPAGVTFGARPVKGAQGAMFCSCVCVPEFMYEHYRILTKDEVIAKCPEAAKFFE